MKASQIYQTSFVGPRTTEQLIYKTQLALHEPLSDSPGLPRPSSLLPTEYFKPLLTQLWCPIKVFSAWIVHLDRSDRTILLFCFPMLAIICMPHPGDEFVHAKIWRVDGALAGEE